MKKAQVSDRQLAGEVAEALEAAQKTYNEAKKANKEQVTFSRRHLYILTTIAANAMGLSIEDANKLT